MNPTEETYRQAARWAEICYRQGVRYAVLSPGSRSAPLALAFLRIRNIRCFIIPDERSAAYTALGISRQVQGPVALVCTSGTAALNYAPAVAEAYFSEIPLIVFTADRPPEWLGQADNQAIYQERLYGRHSKAFFSLPLEFGHADARWQADRQVNEALLIAKEHPKGPVHINVPLREPLYLEYEPETDHSRLKIMQAARVDKAPAKELPEEIKNYSKIAIVAGTHPPERELASVLASLTDKVAIIPDITSNLPALEGSVPFAELVLDTLSPEEKEKLEPELVISFGGPVVSKTLKQFLRRSKASHWHIGKPGLSADTFQRLDKVIDCSALEFFKGLGGHIAVSPEYLSRWRKHQEVVKEKAVAVLAGLPFCEPAAVKLLTDSLPVNCVLHLGNSLPVRYASIFPFLKKGMEVYANRGTSGIDGSLSAAAGHSMTDDRMHILISGDLSFMYDSNGLWNNYLKGNLKIVVLNNHGGGIFRQLPGPVAQKELEEYFVVRQPQNFRHIALQHDCAYTYCGDADSLQDSIAAFLQPAGRPAVLELDFKEAGPTLKEIKDRLKN